MEWKNIPSLNGFYDVSSCGKVRRRAHKVLRTNKDGTTFEFSYSAKELKIRTYHNKGYATISICNKNYLVHRLVAEAWIGPSNGLQVNHKNGVKQDNRVENLEYVTNIDNRRHAVKFGLISRRNTGKGLSIESCFSICKIYFIDKLIAKEIAIQYKITRSAVNNIIRKYGTKFIEFWNL